MLARRVGSDGRTRAYLNGRSATVGELRDVGGALLAFYGQHEHRKLTLSAAQLEILDGLCAGDHAGAPACVRGGVRADAAAGRAAAGRCASSPPSASASSTCSSTSSPRSTRSAPDEREHEQLLAARERLRRLDALRAAAGRGGRGARARLGRGARRRRSSPAAPRGALDALAGVDPALDALGRAHARARDRVPGPGRRAARLLRAGAARMASTARARRGSAPEVSLDALEERLAAIERLARKHGGSVRAVLDYALQARARHEELAGAEVALAQATEQLGDARAALERARAVGAPRARRPPRRASRSRCASSSPRWRWARRASRSSSSEREPGPRRRRRGRVHDRAQSRACRPGRCARSPPAASSRA